ncbi:GPI-anchored protein LLG1-like [Nicotiana tabacum]|uniref:GPI-anchored protein LLG1-like n=2 Tax=Nicotiana TaxID=4085 RepID=A0A1S4AQX1_TOBAC|nr:PREDICTED: GPI-anchored protein LORELEI-like [Nicotiana sylvestris]XP_016478960.1 PREDICTED: GPI-anchored protein LORELEI-like [Nicotiana tabacum]
MEWTHCCSCFILLLSFSLLPAVSSSSSISDGILVHQDSTGRNLLQVRKACPVSFEFQNYRVITSQCKGPQFPAKQCCDAFVQFACPFADLLNDLSNDCSTTMFSYINLRGKYPPGLFASICTGTKQGLDCHILAPSQSANDDANSSQINCKLSPVQIMATAFMWVLLLVF